MIKIVMNYIPNWKEWFTELLNKFVNLDIDLICLIFLLIVAFVWLFNISNDCQHYDDEAESEEKND